LNSRLGARGEEPFESFVPESCDRHITSVTHMVTVCISGGSARRALLLAPMVGRVRFPELTRARNNVRL
jgi:hypothetical protein